MAYYKVRIEVWCDWNPAESDLDDIAQAMGVGEALCTKRDEILALRKSDMWRTVSSHKVHKSNRCLPHLYSPSVKK
jgi:hypothetical protein